MKSTALAEHIMKLAIKIAPPSRRDWAAAMQAELLSVETEQWRWAMGSLWTACTQNLRAQTMSGQVRLIAGLLVATLGLMVLPLAIWGDHMALRIGVFDPMRAVTLATLLVVASLLVFGGAAILLGRLWPALGAAGRWLFGLGGLGFALMQFSIVFFRLIAHGGLEWMHVNAAVGSLAFAGAGLALIVRGPRIYWPLALVALAACLSEALRSLPYVREHGPVFDLTILVVCCLPALLMLAGGALIAEPSHPLTER